MGVILPPSGTVFSDTLDSYFYFDDFLALTTHTASKAVLDAEGLPEGTTLWELFIRSPANTFGLPLDTDNITPGNQLPDPTTVNQTVKDAFIAFVQDYKKSDLWLRFLGMLGVDPNEVTPAELNDPLLQKAFLDFAKGTLSILQNQQIRLASLDEIKKRDIMFKTFEILLKMLATLQDAIGVIGQNLIFYGKWQEAYTKMLTKVPVYVGGASNAPAGTDNVTIDTLDKLTFGYGSISAEDIANWAADKLQGTEIQTLKMTLTPDALNSIKDSLERLDKLDGKTDNYDGVMQQIRDNNFIQVQVDPTTQTVTFSMAGVDLKTLVGTESFGFGTGDYNNFSVQVAPSHIPAGLPHTSGEGVSGNPTITSAIPLGGNYMTGHFLVVDGAGSDAIYKVETGADTQVTIDDPTNFNSNVVDIKNAFVSFWNDPINQGLSTAGNIDGIRLKVNRHFVYDGNPNDGIYLGSLQDIPNDDLWFSDYTLDSRTYPFIIKTGIAAGSAAGAADFTSVQISGKITTTTPTIPWSSDRVFVSDSTDEDVKRKADNASKARAEVNAKLQQFIENIRSRRQLVQEQAQQIESNLSQFKEAVTNWATLMNSILDSMKSIIASTFK